MQNSTLHQKVARAFRYVSVAEESAASWPRLLDKLLLRRLREAGVAKLVDASDLNDRLSAPEETQDADLLKFGETFTGNPEPSLRLSRKV